MKKPWQLFTDNWSKQNPLEFATITELRAYHMDRYGELPDHIDVENRRVYTIYGY